jgi:gliding motility-associated-like protein
MYKSSLAFLCGLALIACLPLLSAAQTFTPVPVSGFNQDVVAESGTSALTTTTVALDAVPASNHVMYTVAFRTSAGFDGGGVPNNGTIVNGSSTYQLADYASNNALLLPRSQSGTLTLVTPAKFIALRLLCFSTEGPSLVSGTINFSDGTTTAIPSFTLSDWFGTTNVVLSGFGRCQRTTPAAGADAYPTNPNMYFTNIALSCADRQKNVQSITLNNITTAGSNAPFPDAVFFALSGTAFSETITPAITNATCSSTGSVTLTITGSTGPYGVTWNTNPVQNGFTATNLAPGTYQATINDEGGCPVVFPVTITQTNSLTLTGNTNTSICAGSQFNTTTTSNATTFAWTANTSAAIAGISNTAIANPVLTPTQTTTYTLTASTGSCSLTNSFTITVNPLPTISTRGALNICTGGQGASPELTSTGTTFLWSPTTGVSDPSQLNPVLNPTATTPYTVTATLAGCTATSTFTAVVSSSTANAGNPVTIVLGASTTLAGSGSTGTYQWSPSTGLSDPSVLTPVATPTVTTPYTLTITTAAGCVATSSVTVTVLAECIIPFRAFTPNGDGFHDKWVITQGSCTKNVSAVVYNRYGSKVFESKNYNNDWDGTYKGKPLPDATYYYVVTITMQTGDVQILKGDVSIIR